MTSFISSPSSVPSWLCAWRSSPGDAYETPRSCVILRVIVRQRCVRIDQLRARVVRQSEHVPDLIAIPQHLLIRENAGNLHYLEQVTERRPGRLIIAVRGQETISHPVGETSIAHDSPFDRAKIAASRDSSQVRPLGVSVYLLPAASAIATSASGRR